MWNKVWAGLICTGFVVGAAAPLVRAQDDSHEHHGRKYKAPPETAHIEVLVLKGFNKKPIMNAAVIFHPIDEDGKDEGTLEVKSGPDGKASLDVVPVGSEVRLQVLATGFATYAEDFKVDSTARAITVNMIRPRAQISAYEDNEGKASQLQPGIQVPVRDAAKKDTPNSSSQGKSGSSSASSPDTSSSNNSTQAKPQL